jgi:hypothetical protein
VVVSGMPLLMYIGLSPQPKGICVSCRRIVIGTETTIKFVFRALGRGLASLSQAFLVQDPYFVQFCFVCLAFATRFLDRSVSFSAPQPASLFERRTV